jgi:hypothetical protein
MLQARKEQVATPAPRVSRTTRADTHAPAPGVAAPTTRARAAGTRHASTRTRGSGAHTALVYLGIAAALAVGWAMRDRAWFTADSDVGYWLGVAGGTLMLLLLLYPLRKHFARLRWMGPTRYWFKLHMTFGLLGPMLILYHCNFHLGSTNSNVALFCMLTVAGSGLVGRYLYAKIHHGLYGSRATLQELHEELAELHNERTPSLFPELFGRLQQITKAALLPARSRWARAARALTWWVRKQYLEHVLMRSVRRELKKRIAASPALAQHRRQIERDAREFVREHLATVRKVAELSFYERLFALWHVFHLPMFLLMVVAALVHVLYVHMY